MRREFITLTFLLAFFAGTLSAARSHKPKQSSALNTVMYSPAELKAIQMTVVLKKRTDAMLSELPVVERAIHRECVNAARTAVALARCLEALFEARRKSRFEQDLQEAASYDGASLLHRIVEWAKSILHHTGQAENIEVKPSTADAQVGRLGRPDTQARIQEGLRYRRQRTSRLRQLSHQQRATRKRRSSRPVQTSSPFQHVGSLKRIREFFTLVNGLGDYVERVNADRRRHQQYFAKLHGKNITASKAKANANDPVVKEANNGLRILSPKLFSLVPDSSADGVLSPNLLNLQEAEQKDGESPADMKQFIASLPSLLEALMKNRRSREGWLNFLLEISGMGEAAERLANRLDPLTDEIQKNLPKAEQIATSSKRFVDVLEGRIQPNQKEDLKRTGFSFFDEEQLRTLRGEEHPSGKPDDSLRGDPDDLLEAEIRRIARMPDSQSGPHGLAHAQERFQRRRKRQGEGNSLIFFVLEPQFFHFKNALRFTAFNALVMSPFFFTTNFLAPEFFNAIILSPIFFEANLGYAQFFFADILSPYIFQANLLSPMFFDAFILSPEIFTADLLSPRILSPRVGSSQIMTATLLSPNIGSPAVFSDDEYVIDVLSPNILSPDTRTHSANFIDILSPDILSGGEEDLDKEDQPEKHKGEEGSDTEHKSESGAESSSHSEGSSSSNSEASSASRSEGHASANSEASSSNAEAPASANSEASSAARSEVVSSVRSEASSSFRVVEAEGK